MKPKQQKPKRTNLPKKKYQKVPYIDEPFLEAMERLVRVKPPKKKR